MYVYTHTVHIYLNNQVPLSHNCTLPTVFSGPPTPTAASAAARNFAFHRFWPSPL